MHIWLACPYCAQANFSFIVLINHTSSCSSPPLESQGSPGSFAQSRLDSGPGRSWLLCPLLGTQTEGLGLAAGSVPTGRLKHTICPNYRECDVFLIGTLDYFPKHDQVINV